MHLPMGSEIHSPLSEFVLACGAFELELSRSLGFKR